MDSVRRNRGNTRVTDSAARGGGGFPTGRKWQFAYAQPAMVKNTLSATVTREIPGAFMDRSILEGKSACRH